MKHYVLTLMAVAALSTTAVAQSRVRNLSTNTTSMNVSVMAKADQVVQLNRYFFAGYNTLCLPVSMTAAQLSQAATDLRVERLAAVKQEGTDLCLYFLDCTNEGIQAGMPYIVYSPTAQTLRVKNTESYGFDDNLTTVCMSDDNGNKVTFSSSWVSRAKEGLYGIPAQQSVTPLQSILVRTEADKTFLPTRCGFAWETQAASATDLRIVHVSDFSEVSAIKQLKGANAKVDIYDLKGQLVKRQMTKEDAKKALPTGVYVIGGEKVVIQ